MTEPAPLPEGIIYDGRNAQRVVDWARQTSEHYERDDKISASGLGGTDPFTLNVNGRTMQPEPGDQILFSDRFREFTQVHRSDMDLERWQQHAEQIGSGVAGETVGPENPWPRDHPMTPTENRVLYQMTARTGELPAGVVSPVGSVVSPEQAASRARHPSVTGQPGVRHPIEPVREPLRASYADRRAAARPPQFGENKITDITSRIGRK